MVYGAGQTAVEVFTQIGVKTSTARTTDTIVYILIATKENGKMGIAQVKSPSFAKWKPIVSNKPVVFNKKPLLRVESSKFLKWKFAFSGLYTKPKNKIK